MIFQLLWKKWKIELAEPCTDRLCSFVLKFYLSHRTPYSPTIEFNVTTAHLTKCSKIFRAHCGDRNLHSWIPFVNINLNEIKLVNAFRVRICSSDTFQPNMWLVSWWQSEEHPRYCQKRFINCCEFTPENMKRECNTLSDEYWIWLKKLRSKRTFMIPYMTGW